MASLTVANVRARVAAILEALGGWTESRFHPDLFGFDTSSLAHHSFAVRTGTTEVYGGERPKLKSPAVVTTTIEILFAHRLRGDAQVVDGDSATDAEQTAVKAVHAASRVDLHLAFQGIGRELRGDGTWHVATIRFQAVHNYDLQ